MCGVLAALVLTGCDAPSTTPELSLVEQARTAPAGTQLLVASGLSKDQVALISVPGKQRVALLHVYPDKVDEQALKQAPSNICAYIDAKAMRVKEVYLPLPLFARETRSFEFYCT